MISHSGSHPRERIRMGFSRLSNSPVLAAIERAVPDHSGMIFRAFDNPEDNSNIFYLEDGTPIFADSTERDFEDLATEIRRLDSDDLPFEDTLLSRSVGHYGYDFIDMRRRFCWRTDATLFNRNSKFHPNFHPAQSGRSPREGPKMSSYLAKMAEIERRKKELDEQLEKEKQEWIVHMTKIMVDSGGLDLSADELQGAIARAKHGDKAYRAGLVEEANRRFPKRGRKPGSKAADADEAPPAGPSKGDKSPVQAGPQSAAA
jgi:hypothetical protein